MSNWKIKKNNSYYYCCCSCLCGKGRKDSEAGSAPAKVDSGFYLVEYSEREEIMRTLGQRRIVLR